MLAVVAVTIAAVSAVVGVHQLIAASQPDSAASNQYVAKKLTICHHTRSKTRPWVTISILETALPAHLRHGDTVGRCIDAFVGPGARIGIAAKSLKQGPIYSIIVSDRSTTDNFHLSGAGLDRKTGIAFRGVIRFKVQFPSKGVYRYRSDAHPRLGGTLIVTDQGQ